jgi:predicted oxidoreductase
LNGLPKGSQKIENKNMNKTQKTVLVTAAIAGLVGGVIANAKVSNGNNQIQNVAGKQAPATDTIRMSCNGCGGKTNKVSAI